MISRLLQMMEICLFLCAFLKCLIRRWRDDFSRQEMMKEVSEGTVFGHSRFSEVPAKTQ